MVILGLTGSIAMGKSTAAGMLRRLGLPVHDADASVHVLLGPGGAAVQAVAAAFPSARRETAQGPVIDRSVLGRLVFGDPVALKRLEAILHPLVRAAERRFLRLAARRRESIVVLDVPLLLETGGERRCDAVAVVSAPAFLQRRRALARRGMTPDRLASILRRQVPDAEKRRRADYVIPTGLGRAFSFAAIRRMVAELDSRPARHGLPLR